MDEVREVTGFDWFRGNGRVLLDEYGSQGDEPASSAKKGAQKMQVIRYHFISFRKYLSEVALSTLRKFEVFLLPYSQENTLLSGDRGSGEAQKGGEKSGGEAAERGGDAAQAGMVTVAVGLGTVAVDDSSQALTVLDSRDRVSSPSPIVRLLSG